MQKQIFVLGMLDWQLKELQTTSQAADYDFHSLLSWEEVVEQRNGFDDLLDRARAALDTADGEPSAIVCHWDFPSSCLAPLLAAEHGLRAPTLDSVLRCEHKYWARLEQRRAVPECVPEFAAVDPFDPDAGRKIELSYPFWLKPVKGYASRLGFRIESDAELKEALAEMQAHVGELGRPFDECLRHAELPEEVRGIGGQHAIAETIMSGIQFAPEGYVLDGEVHIHGFFDMMLDHGGSNVAGLRYPAKLPAQLKERAADICRRILTAVGFDNGCFNVEFLFDEERDKLWLIEVNTRISQSHSEMFRMVDGMSNHEVAISVALGQSPRLPDDRGDHAVAAKMLIQKEADAVATRVPTEDELAALSNDLGGALIEMLAKEGERLSDIPAQPAYCFNVAEAWIGGESVDQVDERYRLLIDRLPIEFADGEKIAA